MIDPPPPEPELVDMRTYLVSPAAGGAPFAVTVRHDRERLAVEIEAQGRDSNVVEPAHVAFVGAIAAQHSALAQVWDNAWETPRRDDNQGERIGIEQTIAAQARLSVWQLDTQSALLAPRIARHWHASAVRATAMFTFAVPATPGGVRYPFLQLSFERTPARVVGWMFCFGSPGRANAPCDWLESQIQALGASPLARDPDGRDCVDVLVLPAVSLVDDLVARATGADPPAVFTAASAVIRFS